MKLCLEDDVPTKRRENIRMWGRASTLLMWKWTRARRDLSVKSFKEVAICKRLARHIPRNLLFCHVAQQVLIEFDGETYRTKSYNKVLDLIFQQTNELRGEKKENGERFPSFSASVPRPGVEPGWILLHWCLRPARLPIPPSGHPFEMRCKGTPFF